VGDRPSSGRWAWAEVDLTAIAHNIEVLRRTAAPAAVWAVVKADGYGHGAVAVAEQAIAAGAAGLCVALVSEGVELREAGIEAPLLLLSEQPVDQLDDIVRYRLTPTVYTNGFVDALAAHGAGGLDVHVLVDTGMQRVGVAPDATVALIRRIRDLAPELSVEGMYTHLACADEPSSSATTQQLDEFDRVIEAVDAIGMLPAIIHAANSAGAFASPRSRYSLVRAGIAIYGISPGQGVDHLVGDLQPALSLHSRVSHVKPVRAGTHVSYGWSHRFERDSRLATIPIGYADGVPRRLGTLPDRAGADVVIRGRRHPIVGVVTMDQLMVDIGTAEVVVGDRVDLISSDGAPPIRAEEWATRLDTIGYEIVCGIGKRIPRHYP